MEKKYKVSCLFFKRKKQAILYFLSKRKIARLLLFYVEMTEMEKYCLIYIKEKKLWSMLIVFWKILPFSLSLEKFFVLYFLYKKLSKLP